MNLALVAPFERGQPFGGSLRATAVAERLENRGATVKWFHIPPGRRSVAEKLGGLVTLRPGLVAYHTARPPPGFGSPQAVVAAHSYMAPYLASLPPDVPRVLDFHNLEWRSLGAIAGGWSPRAAYLRGQALLMRRFERMAIGRASLSLFVTAEELQLADEIAPRADKLFIPNVLPREEVRRAEAIRHARSRRDAKPLLAYVGTLTYPPNRAALRGFLKTVWPHLRKSIPELQLTVVGASSEGFSTVPGIEARGFVPDLTTILSDVSAVVLPFDAGGGSSLRVLFYALADVPVVGSPAAFRGFPSEVGLRAQTPSDWSDLVTAVSARDAKAHQSMAAARDAATARQNAAEPWDALHEAIRALSDQHRPA